VVLTAHARIGEEIKNVPKGAGHPPKILTPQGKNKGRAATGIPSTTRSRYRKLAAANPKIKPIANKLRAEGVD
jgi:hypothetical protein